MGALNPKPQTNEVLLFCELSKQNTGNKPTTTNNQQLTTNNKAYMKGCTKL